MTRHVVLYPMGIDISDLSGTVMIDGILRVDDPFVAHHADGTMDLLWVASSEVHVPSQPDAPVASAEVKITLTRTRPA